MKILPKTPTTQSITAKTAAVTVATRGYNIFSSV